MAGLTETASRNLAGELARHRKTREDLAKAWDARRKQWTRDSAAKHHSRPTKSKKPPTYSASKPPPSPWSSSNQSTPQANSKPESHNQRSLR